MRSLERKQFIAIINDTENCFFIKPIENEELINRVKAQLLYVVVFYLKKSGQYLSDKALRKSICFSCC